MTKMRRQKSGGHATSSTTSTSSASAGDSMANSPASGVSADLQIKEMLKELHTVICSVQEDRSRGENNLQNIGKTHERMQQEQKVTAYYKTKLKGLYGTAMQDAESEAELLRKALDKIAEIKTFRNDRNKCSDRPKPVMRRGVLMTMLQQNALTLPLWIGKPGEKPPPLCGAQAAEAQYVAKQGDKVAARVRSSDGEENWILAEVVSYTNSPSAKYDVDDIDAEEGKERHTLSRRRIVPLPIWKANPETDPEALFTKDTLVYALYPQTTCFYRALIHEPPKRANEDYSVLFEDTSYPDGYSPPLMVPQRYVIICKEDRKK